MSYRRKRTIKTRIVLGFCFSALFIAALFSLYNFLFVYLVEDEFFDRIVRDEARWIEQQWQTDRSVQPRQPFMQLYRDKMALPDEVRPLYLKTPMQREFAGEEGRHYHLYVSDSPEFYLLAEVSDYLVVRPKRSPILIFLGLSSFVMLVMAGSFGYWAATRTTKPLTSLANLVEHTDPKDLPDKFAEQYPSNEIGVLANAIENAMHRIKLFIQREQHFTRDASHELRTPIAVIKSTLALLHERSLDKPTLELVSRIEGASLAMEQAVNALLALAREDKKTDQQAPLKVLPLIEKVVIDHAYLIGKKPVDVDVDIAPDSQVSVPQGVAQIMFSNLISNAFHFTQQGKVSIAFSNSTLRVRDTGVGLDPALEGRETELMVKTGASNGFGIGLSIVERLCEKYQLTFQLQSIDGGTIASIDFS